MAIICPNPNLDPSGNEDHLHHFGIPNEDCSFAMFSDVKLIVCGGSAQRMQKLAEAVHEQFNGKPITTVPLNLSRSDRFVLYKIGPILCVNHGMGHPSLSIMLNEILKLLYYAKATDVTLIRCGTSGGIGVRPGTLVVSTQGINGALKPVHVQYVTGKRIETEAHYDEKLSNDLTRICQELGLTSVHGKTLSANGFYEEQCRENGLFCVYDSDKSAKQFLEKLHLIGVRNIEMESTCMASMCTRAGVKAGAICVALVDRLQTDVVNVPEKLFEQWEALPGRVVIEYAKQKLGIRKI